jgi:transcriptional antiterminator NusG
VGDNVRITAGPLMNFIGVVDHIALDENRVRVTVSMFGRDTPVELELGQVVRID